MNIVNDKKVYISKIIDILNSVMYQKLVNEEDTAKILSGKDIINTNEHDGFKKWEELHKNNIDCSLFFPPITNYTR